MTRPGDQTGQAGAPGDQDGGQVGALAAGLAWLALRLARGLAALARPLLRLADRLTGLARQVIEPGRQDCRRADDWRYVACPDVDQNDQTDHRR